MNKEFIQGIKLSEYLYQETIKPLLEELFPNLPYSAALIGLGSEVLGFDTPQSRDHDWGPRLMLFLNEADIKTYREKIEYALRQKLPPDIHGYPIDLAWARQDGSTSRETTGDPTHHGLSIYTVRGYVRTAIHVEFDQDWRAADWLMFSEQHLRSLTAGKVFHDGLGQLEPLREKLHYYPRDVWLYLLAAQWRRIAQEEPFMGRCGQVGDELGSRLVAARLVKDLMRLCFLMERQYAPYIKWFGTAFSQLQCADHLKPALMQVLAAATWQEREKSLTDAYEFVAEMHNHLGITAPLATGVSQFYERPFRVIQADRFVDAIRAVISSEEVRSLPEHLGSVDQFTDSTDALNHLTQVRFMLNTEKEYEI